MQLLHLLQCTQRGGRQILHVSQYLTCTCFSHIWIVRVLLGTVVCVVASVDKVSGNALCVVQTAVVGVHGVHARNDPWVREGGDEHGGDGCGQQQSR